MNYLKRYVLLLIILLNTISFTVCAKSQNSTPSNFKAEKLIIAIHNDNTKKALKLIEQGGVNLNYKTSTGRTALMECIIYNNFEVFKALIKNKADINAQDNDGFTALMGSIFKKRMDMFKYLLKSKADLNLQNNDGFTALMFSVTDYDFFYILINQKGLKLNLQTKVGNTALFRALVKKKFNIAYKMIEEGADINIKNQYNLTPLLHLTSIGHSFFVQVLLKKGADVNVKESRRGLSPLMMAATFNKIDYIKWFLEKGAKINVKDNNGNTALDYALNKKLKYVIDSSKRAKKLCSPEQFERYKKEILQPNKIVVNYLKAKGAKRGAEL